MIKFILSLLIVTVVITYMIIPVIGHIRKAIPKEAKRIDKAFTKNIKEDELEEK